MKKLKLRELKKLNCQVGLPSKGVVKIVKMKYVELLVWSSLGDVRLAEGAGGGGGSAGGWNHELVISREAKEWGGFPGGAVVKNSPASTGDAGSISGSGIAPGVGNGNPLQYSCLDNSMDRGALQASPLGRKELDTAEQLSMYTVSEDPGGRRFGVPSISA